MTTHFLISSNPTRPTEPDDAFAGQWSTLRDAGFSVSVLPDAVVEDGRRLRGVPTDAPVVYRGWMYEPARYARLCAAIESVFARPFTTPDEYVAAHHLPNWYPLVSDLTAETHVFPGDGSGLEPALRGLGWGAFFVKDFVKSLKTSVGAVLRDPSGIDTLVDEMRRFRGQVEGGVCVRRVETYRPGSEVRYFVLRGTPYAPTLGAVPRIVSAVADRVRLPFFSVDVAERDDGVMRVIELGDGQVSDLVGWTEAAFGQMWSRAATSREFGAANESG